MPVPLVCSDKASRVFAELKSRHRVRRRPVSVSFRALASEVGVGDRLTHLVHPYPAKLLRSIPAFFLSVRQLAPEGSVVWDPFCGSGTVLLEALSAGFDSVGLDVNPLATLISRVKTRRLDPSKIAQRHQSLLHAALASPASPEAPEVVNLAYWFYPHVIRQLTQLEYAINDLRDDAYRDFFRVCFSVCVRRVSLANPRVSVPVRLRPEVYGDGHQLRETLTSRLNQLKRINVLKAFSDIVEDNGARISRLRLIPTRAVCEILTGDVRGFRKRPSKSTCSFMITSPPYLGAQKYVRATSLSLNWLRLADPGSLRPLERSTIGREHLNRAEYIDFAELPRRVAVAVERIARSNPLRAQIAAHYVADLRTFFEKACDWLEPNGYCIIVIGPNTLCGKTFDTPAVALELARECGLSLELELVDHIRSRGLMTRRNRNAAIINREHVLVLRREHNG
jgi:hypothetical protein